MPTINEIKTRHDLLASELSEKQYRLYLAAEAKVLGWGGTSKVAKATGASRNTIVGVAGLKELGSRLPEKPADKVSGGKKERLHLRGRRQPLAADKRTRKSGADASEQRI